MEIFQKFNMNVSLIKYWVRKSLRFGEMLIKNVFVYDCEIQGQILIMEKGQ